MPVTKPNNILELFQLFHNQLNRIPDGKVGWLFFMSLENYPENKVDAKIFRIPSDDVSISALAEFYQIDNGSPMSCDIPRLIKIK